MLPTEVASPRIKQSIEKRIKDMEKKYLVICNNDAVKGWYLRPSDLEFTDAFSDNVIWNDTYDNIFKRVVTDSEKFAYEFEIVEFDED